jgi:RimJ/RimL family protein N-acetyltransferase
MTESWLLRPVNQNDIDSLHALACHALVYRYLFDGAAPSHEFVAERVTQAITNAATPGLGMWILGGRSASCAGCVPNTASLAVMRRLGMRFHRSVKYPLGPGTEYILHRDDGGPVRRPALIPVR